MEIRVATNSDFQEVMRWLEAEYERDDAGFYCNRGVIEEHHNEEGLYVCRDDMSRAVGFITGPVHGPDILSVREENRHQGIGRRLAEHMIQKAIHEDLCSIEIQCTPTSSIPFWKKMGFQMYPNEDAATVYGFRTLTREYELPEGTEVAVGIEFFPESRNWDDSVAAICSYAPSAIRDSEGVIHLDSRVIFVNGLHGTQADTVISVRLDGEECLLGKAKHQAAREMGVINQSGAAFFIDRITPSDSK